MTILKTLNPAEQSRALEILDGSARSDIELFCKGGHYDGKYVWHNLGNLPEDEHEKRLVENAIWWCHKRRLFYKHPIIPHCVRFANFKPERLDKQLPHIEAAQ